MHGRSVDSIIKKNQDERRQTDLACFLADFLAHRFPGDLGVVDSEVLPVRFQRAHLSDPSQSTTTFAMLELETPIKESIDVVCGHLTECFFGMVPVMIIRSFGRLDSAETRHWVRLDIPPSQPGMRHEDGARPLRLTDSIELQFDSAIALCPPLFQSPSQYRIDSCRYRPQGRHRRSHHCWPGRSGPCSEGSPSVQIDAASSLSVHRLATRTR